MLFAVISSWATICIKTGLAFPDRKTANGNRTAELFISNLVRLALADFHCVPLIFTASGGMPEIILSKALQLPSGSTFHPLVSLFCETKPAARRQEN